jgi:hypothetical protein
MKIIGFSINLLCELNVKYIVEIYVIIKLIDILNIFEYIYVILTFNGHPIIGKNIVRWLMFDILKSPHFTLATMFSFKIIIKL